MSQTSHKPSSSGLLLLVMLVQLFAFGLWIGGPRIDDQKLTDHCAVNMRVSAHVGHSLNCDFSEFIQAASSPNEVWGEESKRQSRPGMPLSVYMMGRPLVWLLNIVQEPERSVAFRDLEKGGTIAFEVPRNEVIAGYIGYMVVHFLILIAAYKLYMRLAGGEGLKTAVALAGMLIFANNITKQFLWSPHTQLFNILAPIMAMFFFQRMQQTEQPDRFFLKVSLLCGIGMLFYGIFVIPVIVAGLGWLWRRRSEIVQVGSILTTGFSAIALFALPYALWYGFILLKNGAFYNYDTVYYDGFVWMGRALEANGWSGLFYWLGYNLLTMFKGAVLQGWGYGLVLAGLIYSAYRLKKMPEGVSVLWAGAGLYVLLAALFFALYGTTVARLSFTLVVVFFPLTGFYLHNLETNIKKPVLFKNAILASVCAYMLFILMKYGPYS